MKTVMNVKTLVVLGLKISILTFILFFCYMVASMAVGLEGFFLQTDGSTDTITTLLTVSTLQTIVMSYPIIRSRWGGWRLVVSVFFIFFGVATFLSQIETIVFLEYLANIVSAETIPKLFMQGAIVAALFSPFAVLICGKMNKVEELQESNQRMLMYWTERVWKLALIAVIYVVIYISFGMFVFMPLAGEAFHEYYAGLQLPGWILLLQMARAMIWTALALPVIHMMKGSWREAGLAVALLFSVLMGSQLLLPNEFMPDRIRIAHFVEISSSNFLFGWIIVWLMSHHNSPREIFRWWKKPDGQL